jgi:murein DD-endopeptidase MepM/ murein hydrolase activator NlpD
MISRTIRIGVLAGVLLTGCAPGPTLPRAAVSPSSTSAVAAETPTTAPTIQDSAPNPPSATLLPLAFSTGEASLVLAWRPPPYPVPWSLRPEDHYFLARPIPSGEVNWPSARYRYGGTFFGEEKTHTGVDIGAERGTPVIAAGPGEVIWTGYGLYRGIPDPDDPYGLAVAIRHDFGYAGKVLYTIYAHLSSTNTWLGQRVATGETLGTVGDTGHASGAHLHFEVRLGANDFFSTRNPELWVVSPEGWGVLSGRMMDSSGRMLREQIVKVRNLDSGQEWEVWTYALGAVQPDETFQENFALGDLPAGPYEVRIDYLGLPLTASFLVQPGQTNFIVFRGRSGFLVEPTPTPVPGRFPPAS